MQPLAGTRAERVWSLSWASRACRVSSFMIFPLERGLLSGLRPRVVVRTLQPRPQHSMSLGFALVRPAWPLPPEQIGNALKSPAGLTQLHNAEMRLRELLDALL